MRGAPDPHPLLGSNLASCASKGGAGWGWSGVEWGGVGWSGGGSEVEWRGWGGVVWSGMARCERLRIGGVGQARVG